MTLIKTNSKDFVAGRNSNICGSPIHEKFRGISFHESKILKNFTGINFRESTFLGVKKGIYFREFSQNSRNPRNFQPAVVLPHLISHCISEI